MEFVPEPTAAARRKKFVPAGEVLLVKRAEAKLGNGIIELAESVEREQPSEGTVLAVSSVHKHDYREGQYIAFGKYSGTLFKLNGEEFLLLPAEDVLGYIVDEEE
jgi:chaperonin GroES